MTSCFPDLNVWFALSVRTHPHYSEAWKWMGGLAPEATIVFSRQTQLGLLRLLTNRSAMGENTVSLGKAWEVYDHWLADPRIEVYPEPRDLEEGFRLATHSFADLPASKMVGDCYLLAFAKHSHATLITFDKALAQLARKQHCPVVLPH